MIYTCQLPRCNRKKNPDFIHIYICTCVCVCVRYKYINTQDFFLFLHSKEPWKCVCLYVIPGCNKVTISCLQICNKRERAAMFISRDKCFSHMYAFVYNNLYIYIIYVNVFICKSICCTSALVMSSISSRKTGNHCYFSSDNPLGRSIFFKLTPKEIAVLQGFNITMQWRHFDVFRPCIVQ